MWNLIDSHDTARFLHLCNNNKKKQHLAAAFQLLLPGMPMIYQDKEMFEWYKQLLRVRKTHACIVEGELIETIAKDKENVICLEGISLMEK